MTLVLVALIIAVAVWIVAFILALAMTGDLEDGVVYATGLTVGLAVISGVILGAAWLIGLVLA